MHLLAVLCPLVSLVEAASACLVRFLFSQQLNLHCPKTKSSMSPNEVDLSKSAVGVDSVVLRNADGVVIASIYKRMIKEFEDSRRLA